MPTATVTIQGVPLEADFSYLPFRRGERDSFGAPLTPDEPEEVSVEEIRVGGYEIMCFFDDASIAKVRDAILREGR